MPDWRPQIRERLARAAHDPNAETDLVEELAQDLDERYRELRTQGLAEPECRRRLLRALDTCDLAAMQRQRARISASRASSSRMAAGTGNDLRSTLRGWRRNPTFFLFAVGVLALGIGGTTALFTVAYSVLLKPLPYRDAGRLVYVWEEASAFGFPQNTPAPGNYAAWKSQSNVFTDMAAMNGQTVTLTGAGNPMQFKGAEITANLFPLLGVKPALGRNILPQEDKPGANRVVILSHATWMANFGGDPRIIGRTLTLNNADSTVIGVMPRGFLFPDRATQLWTPIGFSDRDLANHGSHFLHVIARLKPGVSLRAANSDLALVARRLEQEFPATNTKTGALAQPLRDRLAGSSQEVALVLLAAAAFVLLIACANLANLFLARTAGQQREWAMRLALGASRFRIVRLLVVESLLLSGLAGGLGLLLAWSATPFLASLVPSGFAPIVGAGFNPAVLAFWIALSMLSGVVAGLVPALRMSRVELAQAMKLGSAQAGASRGAARMRDGLVVAEFALALMLVSGAGLMLRSFLNLQAVDPGFQPDHVLALRTELPSPKYQDVARRNAFFEQVLARVQHLPGVTAAGCVTWLPLTNWGGAGGLTIPGRPPGDPSHVIIPNLRMISDQYLQAVGMRLLAGRAFNVDDSANSPHVALINQTAARELWPGLHPIGTSFNRDSGPPYHPITVVGIVGDVRQAGLDQPPRPTIYFPYQQWDYFAPGYLAVRTSADPSSLASAIRQQIWAVDKDQPITDVMPLATLLEDDLAPRALQSWLFGGFAAFALLLAALGAYAVLAFSVTQRTREIGVRVALGAQPSGIRRQVLVRGLRLAAWGIGIGVAGALALGQALSSLLFGLTPADPLAWACAIGLLLLVAVAACLLPALRATRVDPMIALRSE